MRTVKVLLAVLLKHCQLEREKQATGLGLLRVLLPRGQWGSKGDSADKAIVGSVSKAAQRTTFYPHAPLLFRVRPLSLKFI